MSPYKLINYKISLLMLLCLAVLILPGCASKSKVFSDFDPRHDFSQDRTFTWVQDPPMLRAGDYIVSPLAESRMTAAIKGELIAKGYSFVTDQSEADFSVLYTMARATKFKSATALILTIAIELTGAGEPTTFLTSSTSHSNHAIAP
ncbi:MAG: hypothetical protein ACJA2E_001473, partial [Arenicella sp.]